MAGTKITALTELAVAPALTDLALVVDVSDLTMAASGTDKYITLANLYAGAPLPAGMDLDDLADVATAGVADNDALTYDVGTNTWVPQATLALADVDRLTTLDASPSTLVLTDDNTDQFLTGSLPWLRFASTGGISSSLGGNASFTINGVAASYGGNDYDLDVLGFGCGDGRAVVVATDDLVVLTGFCNGSSIDIKATLGSAFTWGIDSLQLGLIDLGGMYMAVLMSSSDSFVTFCANAGLPAPDFVDSTHFTYNAVTDTYDHTPDPLLSIIATWPSPVTVTTVDAYGWSLSNDGDLSLLGDADLAGYLKGSSATDVLWWKGPVAVGNAETALFGTSLFNVSGSFDDTDTLVFGSATWVILNSAVANCTTAAFGLFGSITATGEDFSNILAALNFTIAANIDGTADNLRGVYVPAYVKSGTVGNIALFQGYTSQIIDDGLGVGSGTIDEAVIFSVPELFALGNWAVTEFYGLKAPDNSAYATTSWGIYNEDRTYFAKDVEIQDDVVCWFGTDKDVGIYNDNTAGVLRITGGNVLGQDVGLVFEATKLGAGGANDGLMTWMVDQDYFDFQDSVMIDAGGSACRLYFLDTNTSIRHDGTGLNIVDDSQVWVQCAAVKLGTNTAVDMVLSFLGNTADGLLTWDENPGQFQFSHKVLFDGEIEIDGDLNHDGSNIGFFGVAPAARAAALTTQLTTLTYTAPGTPDYAVQDFVDVSLGAGWAFANHDEANTVLSTIANLQTRVSEIETKCQAYGLLQ